MRLRKQTSVERFTISLPSSMVNWIALFSKSTACLLSSDGDRCIRTDANHPKQNYKSYYRAQRYNFTKLIEKKTNSPWEYSLWLASSHFLRKFWRRMKRSVSILRRSLVLLESTVRGGAGETLATGLLWLCLPREIGTDGLLPEKAMIAVRLPSLVCFWAISGLTCPTFFDSENSVIFFSTLFWNFPPLPSSKSNLLRAFMTFSFAPL